MREAGDPTVAVSGDGRGRHESQGGTGAESTDPSAGGPVHAPGAIQAAGALVVSIPGDPTIVQAAGVPDLLEGVGDGTGARLDELVPAIDDRTLDAMAAELETRGSYLGHVANSGQPLDLTAHRNAQGLDLLEIERGTPAAVELEVRRRLEATLRDLEGLTDQPTLVDRIARGFRRLSGYDRVLIHRFAPEGDGDVIADARSDDLPPLLGLRFPASDVPRRARSLLRRVPLRVLVDTRAQRRPLSPSWAAGHDEPTDLSGAVLRAQSPKHLRYLEAMEVRSAATFSLLVAGELWGLVVAHHRHPKRLSATARFAGSVLARWVSREIEVAEERARGSRQRCVDEAVRSLAHRAEAAAGVGADEEPWHGLLDGSPSLLDLVVADGVAVVTEGLLRTRGRVPDDAAVLQLVRWLAPRIPERGVWSTDRLPDVLHGLAPRGGDDAAPRGILAARLSGMADDFILWFRDEAVRTITWAGDPEARRPRDGSGHPGPRAGFPAWREPVRGRSWPWEAWERDAAAALELALAEVDRRSGAEVRLRADLMRQLAKEVGVAPNERTGDGEDDAAISFTRLAAHDLKEPLRGMRGYARFLLEDHGDHLDDDGRHMLGALERLSGRLEQLVDDLAVLTRSTRGELHVDANVPVAEALASVLELLAPRLEGLGAVVEVEGALPTIRCDRRALEQVLANLLVNAARYSDGPVRRIRVGVETGSVPPVIFVSDDGIGIAEHLAAEIFEPFRRLHPRGERGDGSGLGLAIVSRLVGRHGGRVWVDSAPGEGSTFRFTMTRGGTP